MAFKIPSKRRRSPLLSTPTTNPRSRGHPPSRARSSPRNQLPGRAPKSARLAPYNSHDSSTIELPPSASLAPSENEHDRDREAEGQEQVENESIDQIVMAVDMRDEGTVGCCYYLAARETIYLMVDIKSAGVDIVDLRKF